MKRMRRYKYPNMTKILSNHFVYFTDNCLVSCPEKLILYFASDLQFGFIFRRLLQLLMSSNC